ncbi:aspartyl-phosphate phosphatase Spo0E family protein [Halalkalibacter oceani]|uniref:Aspartyl-phosphate phosphatase Spo0E family protein n=1 Tax=Halalkalibacter oceani TaxID=1653776 RepID=A0A9X2DVH4_9BACI|nr:aspartyl-phosphate phosphatase Spo0E family protein [Halalkalibacter oceani]MCM3716083.1 aspartyl-phosphate phosphatase Spo0E family protein [Halalkalibacter oceani]
MSTEKQLLAEIEHYRQLLNEKAKTNPLPSAPMVCFSKKLDQLLNKYNNLTRSLPPQTRHLE